MQTFYFFCFLVLFLSVYSQMHKIFIGECDKYKDLIHVHSFAHDFHLRCVQAYLSKEESSIFPTGFDMDCFLSDFNNIFPYPPSFSRNCLKQGKALVSWQPVNSRCKSFLDIIIGKLKKRKKRLWVNIIIQHLR